MTLLARAPCWGVIFAIALVILLLAIRGPFPPRPNCCRGPVGAPREWEFIRSLPFWGLTRWRTDSLFLSIAFDRWPNIRLSLPRTAPPLRIDLGPVGLERFVSCYDLKKTMKSGPVRSVGGITYTLLSPASDTPSISESCVPFAVSAVASVDATGASFC